MSSWRAKDVISQKHASSLTLSHGNSSVAQNLTRIALLILICSIMYEPSSFIVFSHLLNQAFCWVFASTLLTSQLHPLSYFPGSVTSLLFLPPPTLLGVPWRSLILSCSSFVSSRFSLILFLEVEGRGRVTWQMVQLHGWHLGYISLRFS